MQLANRLSLQEARADRDRGVGGMGSMASRGRVRWRFRAARPRGTGARVDGRTPTKEPVVAAAHRVGPARWSATSGGHPPLARQTGPVAWRGRRGGPSGSRRRPRDCAPGGVLHHLRPASQGDMLRPFAGIAQLVEHKLPKLGVASSNLVSRSISGGIGSFRPVREPAPGPGERGLGGERRAGRARQLPRSRARNSAMSSGSSVAKRSRSPVRGCTKPSDAAWSWIRGAPQSGSGFPRA